MAESMIERVARAIDEHFDPHNDGTRYDAARAIIQALREPSDAMLEGLYDDPIWDYKDSYIGKQQVIDMWEHMIDAALNEPPGAA